ncbi:MAG: decaprenyl-phosphate phosphoribosyltransferase [Candidatus Eiseniibacteriota bacterium]
MIGAFLRSLRPRQWSKNLLLFAGVLFSRQIGDPALLVRAVAGFAAFSLLASSVYVLNDILDAAADRLHPRKRSRPIASGELPVPAALAGLIPVLAVAVALSIWLGREFLLVMGVYLMLNLAYSLALKRYLLLDVFVIAIGFVLRAIAGVALLRPVAPATQLSPWLLVCTFFGALFLGLAKRRRELTGESAGRARAVLEQYSPELLDSMLVVSAAASLMSYALYTIWPATVAKFHTEALMFTVPLVAYGIFRYLYLVRVSEQTEDPSMVLLGDRPLGLCVLLYVVAVGLILYSHAP